MWRLVDWVLGWMEDARLALLLLLCESWRYVVPLALAVGVALAVVLVRYPWFGTVVIFVLSTQLVGRLDKAKPVAKGDGGCDAGRDAAVPDGGEPAGVDAARGWRAGDACGGEVTSDAGLPSPQGGSEPDVRRLAVSPRGS